MGLARDVKQTLMMVSTEVRYVAILYNSSIAILLYCVHNSIGSSGVHQLRVDSPPQAAIDKPLKFPGSLDDQVASHPSNKATWTTQTLY